MGKGYIGEKFTVDGMITERVTRRLDEGIVPWAQPHIFTKYAWKRGNGKNYIPVNQLMLGVGGEYITPKKLAELGGHVKTTVNAEGVEKKVPQTQVVGYFVGKHTETDAEGNETEVDNNYVSLKYFGVYNVALDTDLEVRYNEMPTLRSGDVEELAGEYIMNHRILFFTCDEDAVEAEYNADINAITMPDKDRFFSEIDYLHTLLHEVAHAAAKNIGVNMVGEYSFEADSTADELIAEITACSILADYGIAVGDTLARGRTYCEKWSVALKNDLKMITKCANIAKKCYNEILGIGAENE